MNQAIKPPIIKQRPMTNRGTPIAEVTSDRFMSAATFPGVGVPSPEIWLKELSIPAMAPPQHNAKPPVSRPAPTNTVLIALFIALLSGSSTFRHEVEESFLGWASPRLKNQSAFRLSSLPTHSKSRSMSFAVV